MVSQCVYSIAMGDLGYIYGEHLGYDFRLLFFMIGHVVVYRFRLIIFNLILDCEFIYVSEL